MEEGARTFRKTFPYLSNHLGGAQTPRRDFGCIRLLKCLRYVAIATFCIASNSIGDITRFSVIPLGDLVTPDQDLFHRRFKEIPLYIVMGIYGGILGAVFNNIWHWINCKRQRLYVRFRIHKNWIKLFEVGFVSLTTSSLSFALPLAFSRACRPVDVNIDYSNDDFTDDASLHQFWNATNSPFEANLLILRRPGLLSQLESSFPMMLYLGGTPSVDVLNFSCIVGITTPLFSARYLKQLIW